LLRGWSAPYGGVPEGYRDLVLFLGSVALSWLALPATWWGEVQSLAAELTPSLRRSEWQTYVGTAHRRLLASVGDGKQEQRYRYSTARIVCDLGISREEMASLEMLIDPDLTHTRKLERDRVRDEKARRARGAVQRDTYLSTAADLSQQVAKLSSEGYSLQGIADRMGISRATIQSALKRAKQAAV
jgi:DNA-binding CsgD family transcriptional regulator